MGEGWCGDVGCQFPSGTFDDAQCLRLSPPSLLVLPQQAINLLLSLTTTAPLQIAVLIDGSVRTPTPTCPFSDGSLRPASSHCLP